MPTQQISINQTASKDAFVNVQDGRVHYVHAGTGPPILLIHGLTGSAANWRLNFHSLALHAHVYAIDLLNMGQSQRVRGLDASLAATADRVAAFMDALGIAAADIAGHSHGGAVALMFASRHPGRVRRLLLFAPANPYCTFGHRLIRLYNRAFGRLLAHLVPRIPRWIKAISLKRMYGDPSRIVKGSLEGYIDGLGVPGTMRHILAIVRGWFGDMAALEAALPCVTGIPTLMMWGDRDRAVSLASGRRLQRELPRSKLVVVPTGGHIVFEELPQACNLAMTQWLRFDHASTVLDRKKTSTTLSRVPHAVGVAV